MPKPVIAPTDIDITTQKNFTAIKEVLGGGMGLDNFNQQVIEGITSETPDQEKKFIHSCSPQPCGWFPLAGDVYVQAIDSKTIDVRSTKASVAFKIVVIKGPQITQEVAVNPPDYQDTTDIINVTVGNDGGTTTEGSQSGTDVNITINQCILPASNSVVVNSITTDGTYIYCTFNHTSGNGYIYRINMDTGATTSLQASTNPVGPLYYDGTDLWTMEINTTGPSAFKISTSAFTVTTTYTNCGDAGYFRAACIFANATHVYSGGRSTLSTDRVCFFRRALSGGATSEVTIGNTSSATNARGNDFVSDGTYMYMVGQGHAAENTLFRSTMSNFNNTDKTSYAYGSADGRAFYRLALYDRVVYCLYARMNGTGSANRTGDNGYEIVLFDTVGTSFIGSIPVTTGQQYPSDRGAILNTNFFIDDDGFAYITNCVGNLIEVSKIDLETGDQTIKMFPISFPSYTLQSVPTVWNNVLIKDYNTGTPLVVRPGPNSIYFYPTFG